MEEKKLLYPLKPATYLTLVLSLMPVNFAIADMKSIVAHTENSIDKDEYKEAIDKAEKNKLHHTELELTIDRITQKVKENKHEYAASIAAAKEKTEEYKSFAENLVKETEEGSKKYAANLTKKEGGLVDGWISDYRAIKDYQEDEREGLYIFVSFSMSSSQLLKLSEVARKVGARLVIRGLKDNSFKETLRYIKQLNEEGIAVDVDPVAFAKFNVNLVPSFVVSEGDKFDKITGNISLKYALEQFIESGETASLSKEYLGLGNEN